MNQKHLFFTVILLVSVVVSGCGPSSEQVATMTAMAWTATPASTATQASTATPPFSAEVRGEADQAFASGLVVYLYDLQPNTESRSLMGTHDFSLRYILSKDAKAVPNSLLIWKVDANGSKNITIPFGTGSLEDWTSETGQIIFSPVPDNNTQITDLNGVVVLDVDNTLYLDIVLVANDTEGGQTNAVSDSSRKLSNVVRIPVSQ